MTAAVLILVGAFLCFTGARSVRLAVVVAGGGGAWLLADALGADVVTTLVVAAVAAAGTLVATILLARFLLFTAGLVMGATVGSELFHLIEHGEGSWLLAVIFVPAAGLAGGYLAERLHQAFIVWGTAFAGAALVLGGIGRIGTDPTEALHRPDGPVAAVVAAALWLALGLSGRTVQAKHRHEH